MGRARLGSFRRSLVLACEGGRATLRLRPEAKLGEIGLLARRVAHELILARLVWLRHVYALGAVPGGSLERKAGIGEMRAPEGDEIGAPRRENRVRLIGARDRRRPPWSPCAPRCGSPPRRASETCARRRGARAASVWPLDTSTRSAPASAKAAAIAIASSPVMPPSCQSDAEMRTDIGFVEGHTSRMAVNTSSGKRSRFSSAAAILVFALVRERREEAREQIAVGRVQLEHVEAGALAALGRLHELGSARGPCRRASSRAAPGCCG